MSQSVRRSTALRAAFWLCALTLLVLSLMPISPTLPSTGWDKSNHLLGFFVLTLLGLSAYRTQPVVTVLGLVGYGGLIEVLQSLTPHRFAEWGDLLADAIGVGLAWLLMVAFERAVARYRSN